MQNDDFKWPVGYAWIDMADRIASALTSSPGLGSLINDPKFHIHTFMSRTCLEYGIHPKWILTSLQRERSLLRKAAPIPTDFDLACGYVGSDAPGTLNPSWNGLANQIWRCARHSSWYGDIAPKACFGYDPSLWPTVDRWHATDKVWLTAEKRWYTCQNMAEFIQLKYTPHLQVLAKNDEIYQQFVAPHFEV